MRFEKNEVVREMATMAEIEAAFMLIRQNLQHRIEKFGMGKHASPHESRSILQEEVEEVGLAIHANNLEEFAAEMNDVAVTAVWSLASIIRLNNEQN